VFAASEHTEALWQALLGQGIMPCGLGARDTLRLEAGFPLYGHELSDEYSPLDTHLAWAVKLHKSFLGREAMQGASGHHQLVGLRLAKAIPREGYAVQHHDQTIGTITSGTMSPSLKTGIALAYLPTSIALGDTVTVLVRNQGVDAVVVSPNFLQNP
jgi:aminomethyltransferase